MNVRRRLPLSLCLAYCTNKRNYTIYRLCARQFAAELICAGQHSFVNCIAARLINLFMGWFPLCRRNRIDESIKNYEMHADEES